MDSLNNFFSLSFSLFLLMDPIGNVPIFLSILKKIDPKRARIIILRELLIALGIIILFTFIGAPLLKIIGVAPYTVMIAGGIILFILSLNMIFPSTDSSLSFPVHKEPLIVPLAIPLVAGPAVLAAVILYSYEEKVLVTIFSIIVAWIASTIILLISASLRKFLGERGLLACERLMGLLVILIAVEMFLKGLTKYLFQASSP